MPIPLRILNAEPEDYSPEARRILQSVAQLEELALSREALLAGIAQYDGLIVRLGHRIDRELLDRATRLRFVATPTTGLNHVDVAAAQERGIAVLSLKGEREFLDTVTATAEHTWGLLLALIRQIPEAAQHVQDGGWNRNLFKGRDLCNQTLGIVGYGRLGSKVGRYAQAFGMTVVTYDPAQPPLPPGVVFVPLDELFTRSDIVSVHVPYDAATRNLIGVRELGLMKTGAYVINTSRGEVLDEQALLEALEAGHLAGAALDVLCGEYSGQPDWMRYDLLIRYARTHPNLLITPHIGGATYDSMHKTECFLAQKIRTYVQSAK